MKTKKLTHDEALQGAKLASGETIGVAGKYHEPHPKADMNKLYALMDHDNLERCSQDCLKDYIATGNEEYMNTYRVIELIRELKLRK